MNDDAANGGVGLGPGNRRVEAVDDFLAQALTGGLSMGMTAMLVLESVAGDEVGHRSNTRIIVA